MIKHFLKIVAFLILSLNLNAQSNRPNIVLIMADDIGIEGVYANGGTSYKTPNVDKLASQGIRFENGHALPVCTSSRVQLMTGKYNVRNYTKFAELDRSQTTFGNYFKNAGYKTAIAGKWQLGSEKDSPQHFGFEESCLWQHTTSGRSNDDGERRDKRYSNPMLEFNGEVKNYTNGEYGPDITSDFICNFIEKNKDVPFFAYYAMMIPHYPFVPTPDSKDWDPTFMGQSEGKGDTKYFPDMVAYMDKLVGKVVAKIDELGIAENTLIIFIGDNGTERAITSQFRGKKYPGGKRLTSDNGTRIPMVVRWTGKTDPGKECYDLVDFSDFLPTIAEVANIEIPTDAIIDGQSFLPQILGQKGNPREWIYSWYSPNGKENQLKEWARNTEYKLYTNGEFYNVNKDFYEKSPIAKDQMTKEENDVFNQLLKVLKSYENIRQIN